MWMLRTCPPFIALTMTPHVQDLVSHEAVNTQILGPTGPTQFKSS